MWLRLLMLFFLSSCTAPFSLVQDQSFPSSGSSTSQDEHQDVLRIMVLDVGQGDATLIIGPEGKTVLIDGGPPFAGPQKIRDVLKKEGIGEIDEVVATHYDLDHIGGLPELLKEYPPGFRLLDRGDSTVQDLPLFHDYLDISAPVRQSAEPGDLIYLGTNVLAHVVVVNGHYSDGRKIHLNPDEENEASIGLLVEYGDFLYFAGGDLTGGGAPGGYPSKDLETTAGEIIGDIDILHVGHHGSETSTNETFLGLTRPEVAVISVGRDNDYGHPSAKVLRRIDSRGIEIFRTDRDGDIEISSDGENYEIRFENKVPQKFP